MKISLNKFIKFSFFFGLCLFALVSLFFIYNSARKSITRGFEDKMSGIGDIVSSIVVLDELKAVWKLDEKDVKASPVFLRYYRPLNRIMNDTQATYLYTFFYGGEKDILYMVDGTDFNTDGWSPPNTQEESIWEDLKEGLAHGFRFKSGVSDIYDNKEWGLMRSGTYPIYDSSDRSFYMTGVDISIGEILSRSMSVMTKAALIFILIATFALLLVSTLAKALSDSVNNVKNEVLRIGADENSDVDFSKAPSEIKELANIISDYSKKVNANMQSILQRSGGLGARALVSRVRSYLQSKSDGISFYTKTLSKSSSNYSSACKSDNFYYVWSFKSEESECENVLKSSALENQFGAGNQEVILNSDICIAYAKYDEFGNLVKSFGSKISPNFVFNEYSKIEKASFIFEDGTKIVSFKKGDF